MKVPLLMLVIIMIIITRVILIKIKLIMMIMLTMTIMKERSMGQGVRRVRLSESCMHCAFNLQISQLSVADINQLICR